MRKVLLSVMMVSSLLAFNACKKDGAVGPAGPAGPTGATGAAGAAGAVGAAGAKGADGSKIYSGALAASAAVGVVGDYLFDPATRTLYGPKTVATAWPATGTALNGANGATGATGATGSNGATGATGANGATGAAGAVGATGAAGVGGVTGATGANGSQLLAGNGAPTAADGVNGDFYFDKLTSTFYGPKTAGVWTLNVLPLGSAYAAKTFYLTRGFEGVTQVTRTQGEVANVTYGNFDIITTFTINADDALRIANYPGWGDNREMIFETTAGSGVFDQVADDYLDFGTPPFTVGRRFMYTNNTNLSTTFDLTATDIARLTSNAGAAFEYLTYAKATTAASNPGNSYTPIAAPTAATVYPLTTGQTLNFARNKTVTVAASTVAGDFNATYTAQTKLDINNIPGLGSAIEKYKQDGKVFVKYKYFSDNTGATPNVPQSTSNTNAGWVDITAYANSYVKAINYGVDNVGTVGIVYPGPFAATPYSQSLATPFLAGFMGTGSTIGNVGTVVTLAPNQTATAIIPAAGQPGFGTTTAVDGNFVINWSINSGTNLAGAATATPFGPTTYFGQTIAATSGFARPAMVTRAFSGVTGTPASFYAAPQLTSNRTITLGSIPVIARTGGQAAAYFTGTKLVQVQVFVIPGNVIQSAKAKGLDVNNAQALQNFIKL